jgi:hypothetical protein
LRIENVYTTNHVIKLLDCREFNKTNINALIEKWMLCDALWVFGTKKVEFCLITKGNKKYSLEEYIKTMHTYFTYSTYNKKEITKKMKDRNGRGYTFMGTHDRQKEIKGKLI